MAKAKQMLYTKEGFEALQAELKERQTVKREEIKEAIALARSFGDLSENSEYDAARNEQAQNEARILELQALIDNALIIDETKIDSSVVSIGSTVKVYDNDFDEEIEKAIKRADELGLATMVCADSIEEVKAIAKLGPNILVAEPTELIGTGKPADKEYVDEVIRVIREINPDIKPFPSAGISKGEDCYNIIKAGSSASGCSSAIAKAENPLALAEEMISAVRRAYDERQGK